MERERFRRLVHDYLTAARSNLVVPNVLPEPALYGPFEELVNAFLKEEGPRNARLVAQRRTEYGIPDFVLDAGAVLGYVEAKRPGTNLSALRGRDRLQKQSLLNLPTLLYTNFHKFQLFEDGEGVETVSLGDADVFDPTSAVEPSDRQLEGLQQLLVRFCSRAVETPRSADELAIALARVTRVLRDAASATLQADPRSALAALHREWQQLLFEDTSDEEFADAYAQTVAYGLLTARLATSGRLSVESALEHLHHRHEFLAAALRYFTDPQALDEIGWAIRVLVQVLDGVSLETFRRSRHPDDPLLYFYEDFLGEYDPDLRNRRGVYYTPASVVDFQVRAVAEVLQGLGRPRLLADDVVALDPAAGTGTYLLALLDETADRVQRTRGDAAVAAAAQKAARQLHGFELLVGPYTVSHQRLAARLDRLGAGGEPVRVYLIDTLRQPHAVLLGQLPLFQRQLGEERSRADAVKRETSVMVVLGNPPYDRAKGRDRTDWLQDMMSLFTEPVRGAARRNLKNLADEYVRFFRWGLWKLFESTPPSGPRVLSFVSNRSYLLGDAFEGLRLALRQRFDELWIVDLEGESRGAMPSENVFDIRVGVAVIVALRRDASHPSAVPANVRYVRATGSRADKEELLKTLTIDSAAWQVVSGTAGDPLLPAASPEWMRWPALDELMPRRHSGVETKRDALVVGVTREETSRSLRRIQDDRLPLPERQLLFHETPSRALPSVIGIDARRIRRYGYRPFDIRWLYDDVAFIDRPRPKLRRDWHEGQRALVTLPKGHGPGPVVVVQPELPDRHAFRGNYGGHVFPLWLDTEHLEPNLVTGCARGLRAHLHPDVSGNDILGYLLALLSAPVYQQQFHAELALGFPRVPFTTDVSLFHDAANAGREVLAVYDLPAARGIRLDGRSGPITSARWEQRRLHVTDGAWVSPVSRRAWEYSVSGYRVIDRWIAARVGVDLAADWEVVDQLLRVVFAVEQMVTLSDRLDGLLMRVLEGTTFGRQTLLGVDLRVAPLQQADSAPDVGAAMADEWAGLSDEALRLAEGE